MYRHSLQVYDSAVRLLNDTSDSYRRDLFDFLDTIVKQGRTAIFDVDIAALIPSKAYILMFLSVVARVVTGQDVQMPGLTNRKSELVHLTISGSAPLRYMSKQTF